MKRKIFLSLIITLLTIATNAQTFEVGGISYRVTSTTEKTVEVTSKSSGKYEGSIDILATVSYGGYTYTVTGIGPDAFYYCSGLNSVTIPNSVANIGPSAFRGCSALTFVEIPNSVTSIGSYAFNNCSRLTSITIPNSVTSIGENAFCNCFGLTSILIGNSLERIEKQCFMNCRSLVSVLIGNSVISIGTEAFYGCSSLLSIEIPNSVKTIGQRTFQDCSNLTKVILPSSITNIGGWAFCSINIEELTCYAVTPPSMGNDAVFYNSNFRTATLKVPAASVSTYKSTNSWKDWGTIEAIQDVKVGDTFDSDGITYKVTLIEENTVEVTRKSSGEYSGSVDIPATVSYDGSTYSVTGIGEKAFAGCSALTSITIGNSVTSIGKDAFYKCYSLTSVTIPNSVTSIGSDAFSGCSALTSVTIPNSVTSIASSAFGGCSGLTSVTIPNSVTSIERYAFDYCSALTSITIPNSVTSIGESAFRNCRELSEVISYATTPPLLESSVFGNTKQSTGILKVPAASVSAYKSADQWKDWGTIEAISGTEPVEYFEKDGIRYHVTAENTVEVTSYPDDNTVYSGDIVIPATVTYGDVTYSVNSIGTYAFYRCSELKNVFLPNSVTSIGSSAFRNCSNLTSFAVPDSVTSLGAASFNGCYNLVSIVIGHSVTNIGYMAFDGCSSLSEVICYATTPPTLGGSDVFAGTKQSTGTLKVPYASVSAYKSADQWKDWGTIEDVEYFVKDGIRYHVTSENTVEVVRKSSGAYSGSVVIPATVSYIGVAYNVTRIGRQAFWQCTGLTSIVIPNSVTGIGLQAFEECTSITSIVIPNSVTSIDVQAFQSCSSLTSVVIPSSVTSIGSAAFNVCSSLTSLTVASGNKNFSSEDNVMFDKEKKVLIFCAGGKKGHYTIPNSVTSIYDNAFRACSGITSVTIPNSVTSIGYSAFSYCTNITSFEIPNSVRSIGDAAFIDCTNLSEVTCYATTPPTLGYGVFSLTKRSTGTLKVPAASVSAYKSADQWKDWGTIEAIPGAGLVIVDGSDYPDVPSSYVDIAYHRGFSNSGYWEAMTAPVAIDVTADGSLEYADIYALSPCQDSNGDGVVDNKDDISIIVKRKTIGNIEPNSVCLIRTKTAGEYNIPSADNVYYTNATRPLRISTGYDTYRFDIVKQQTLASGSRQYVVGSGSKLQRCTTATAVTPNRWIMTIENGGSSSLPQNISILTLNEDVKEVYANGARRFVMIDDLTGISNINADGDAEAPVYTIDGRRMNGSRSLPAGVYITNGKKMYKKTSLQQ